jgi:hypothetical protein
LVFQEIVVVPRPLEQSGVAGDADMFPAGGAAVMQLQLPKNGAHCQQLNQSRT